MKENSMTIGDIIKEKDYSLIEVRITLPEELGFEEKDTLFGYCKSEKGNLISLDGDSYYETDEILSYEEWENEGEICLTVVIEGEVWTGENKNAE